MPDVLLITLEDEAVHASQPPEVVAELIAARARFAGELRGAGKLRDAGRLRPSSEGKRARRDGGRFEVRDGPFADDGRAVAGYHWVVVDGVDEAEALARACPVLACDVVEVRPLLKGSIPPGKDDKPGKLVAGLVLGAAPTEAAWVDVMDRIDAATSGQLSAPSFLGGLRLQPPTTGRRVGPRDTLRDAPRAGPRAGPRAARRDRPPAGPRVVLDGPFLESKEIIGGLFLLRVPSMGDALRWAERTEFVAQGTLEMRALWRT